MSTEFNSDNYVHVLAERVAREFAFHGRTPQDVEAWQEAFRPRLRAALGIDRIEQIGRCDLASCKLGEEMLDDHIREEWTIETEPGYRIPFYFLRPLRQDGPLPLVITPHGHGKLGKSTYVGIWHTEEERTSIAEGERDIALQAVRAGCVAIAPDMRAFASMRMKQQRDEDACNSCRTLQMHALLFGRTLIGERVWDIGRLIDYAATRPEADLTRVAVTGNSGGGTVSLFASACDERIALGMPSCYFCTFEHSIGSIRHCECNYVPGIMTLGEMYDVAGLICPRPLLIVAGKEDAIFPIDAVRFAHEQVRKVYQAAGVPERCRLSVGEGGHRYYKKDVWPFVREFFGD